MSRIVSFVARSSLPPVSSLDKRNITAFKSKDEAVFIAYPESEDRNLRSTFRALATQNHDRYSFGMADSALGKTDNVPPGCVVCHKTKTEEQKILCGQSKLEALEDFMETAAAPLIGDMTRRNEMKYLKVSFPFYFSKVRVVDLVIPGREISDLYLRNHGEGAFIVQGIIGTYSNEV